MDEKSGIRRKSHFSATTLLRRILMFTGAFLLVLTLTPVVQIFGWMLDTGGDYQAKGDVLVILSGSTLESGIMGESSYWRAAYAVEAWREGGFRQIVVAGGSDPKTPISTLIAAFLRASGVPGEVITTETRSDNTRENALYTRELLARMPGKKVLLTSDYHMFRALHTFRKAGIEVTPRPVRDVLLRGGGFTGRWGAFLSVCTELPKIPVYAARGWL